jgi:hypothetical protein
VADEPARPGVCIVCGCAATQKVCRAVPETKKVPRVEFSCECEAFCVPGASCCVGAVCECDDCGRPRKKLLWEPGCAQVRTRKILKKSTAEDEVMAYKWVVEEYCCRCAGLMGVGSAPPGAEERSAAPGFGGETVIHSASDTPSGPAWRGGPEFRLPHFWSRAK